MRQLTFQSEILIFHFFCLSDFKGIPNQNTKILSMIVCNKTKSKTYNTCIVHLMCKELRFFENNECKQTLVEALSLRKFYESKS